MGPIRFDFALPVTQGQVRSDPVLQLLGRRDVLATTGDSTSKAGAPQTGAPVVTSDGTRFLAKIRFFPPSCAPLLAEVASWCGATLASEADAGRAIVDVAALDEAGPGDLTFLDNPRYLDALRSTRAAAALVAPRHARAAPAGCAVLLSPEPYRAMAMVMAKLFPSAVKPRDGLQRDRDLAGGLRPPVSAARAGRHRRARRGDRAQRRDRRGHDHRPAMRSSAPKCASAGTARSGRRRRSSPR